MANSGDFNLANVSHFYFRGIYVRNEIWIWGPPETATGEAPPPFTPGPFNAARTCEFPANFPHRPRQLSD